MSNSYVYKSDWGQVWRLNKTWHTIHREDGPAVEYENADVEWYLFGVRYSKQNYFKELEKLRGKEHADMIRLIYV